MRTETILKLARMTDTNYCHRDHCGCGGDEDGTYPNLLFTNVAGGNPIPDWLPHWANGCDPEELYTWAQEQAWESTVIATALSQVGLRQYKKYRSGGVPA